MTLRPRTIAPAGTGAAQGFWATLSGRGVVFELAARSPYKLADAMNGEPLRRTVTINNPQGLHMRPITAFVEIASKYQSNVFLSREGGPRLNGKSPLALLGLAAEKGTELILEVSGSDEQAALDALADLLANLRTVEERDLPETP